MRRCYNCTEPAQNGDLLCHGCRDKEQKARGMSNTQGSALAEFVEQVREERRNLGCAGLREEINSVVKELRESCINHDKYGVLMMSNLLDDLLDEAFRRIHKCEEQL